MSMSRVIGILLLIVQLGNMGMFLVEGYAPDYAVYVAAAVGAVQAFVSKIQSAQSE
jgi:hypothetical protein